MAGRVYFSVQRLKESLVNWGLEGGSATVALGGGAVFYEQSTPVDRTP